MANINLVNLNDAVHRLLNPAWAWLHDDSGAGVSTVHFNETNCPRLHQRDRKEVPTWKDFIIILSGNENILDTYTSGRATRCCAISEYADYTSAYRPWGRTFGKHTGPNGRPLAEVKPLDEMFWFYDACRRELRRYNSDNATNGSASDPCRISAFYYYNDATGWRSNWSVDGVSPSTQGYHTLQPGVYGVTNSAYNAHNVYSVILDDSGPLYKGSEQVLTRAYSSSAVWKEMNAIFFIDSPTRFRWGWSATPAGGGMMGSLFRITPPGYWV